MENTMITSAMRTLAFARPRTLDSSVLDSGVLGSGVLDSHAPAAPGFLPVGAGVWAYVSGTATAAGAGLRDGGLPVAQRDAGALAATFATNSITATEGPPRGTPR